MLRKHAVDRELLTARAAPARPAGDAQRHMGRGIRLLIRSALLSVLLVMLGAGDRPTPDEQPPKSVAAKDRQPTGEVPEGDRQLLAAAQTALSKKGATIGVYAISPSRTQVCFVSEGRLYVYDSKSNVARSVVHAKLMGVIKTITYERHPEGQLDFFVARGQGGELRVGASK